MNTIDPLGENRQPGRMRTPPDPWRDKDTEPPPPPDGWAACSVGDLVPADVIRFEETVWRRKQRIGARLITAEVLGPDSPEALGQWPNAAAGDGWVYLGGLGCDGDHPDEVAGLFRRKPHVVERNGIIRKLWADETARAALLTD